MTQIIGKYSTLIHNASPCLGPQVFEAELLWQFLLHADRAGIDLSRFQVKAESTTITLDYLLALGLDFHDEKLFNGISYATQVGDPLNGRQYAAPINHAADTLRDLVLNLGK